MIRLSFKNNQFLVYKLSKNLNLKRSQFKLERKLQRKLQKNFSKNSVE